MNYQLSTVYYKFKLICIGQETAYCIDHKVVDSLSMSKKSKFRFHDQSLNYKYTMQH